MPKDYRTKLTFLGSWSVAAKEGDPRGAAGLHNVYTQLGTVEAFRKTGKFPDGAVLVKELLKTNTEPMTTGQVSRGDEIEGWFVVSAAILRPSTTIRFFTSLKRHDGFNKKHHGNALIA